MVNLNIWGKIQKISIIFSVPINKELNNDKTITYKLEFIDSFRFMSSSLPSLVNNLSETYSKVCRGCRERKNIESVCDFKGLKNNKLHHKCNICKKMADTLFANLAMLLLASLFCY